MIFNLSSGREVLLSKLVNEWCDVQSLVAHVVSTVLQNSHKCGLDPLARPSRQAYPMVLVLTIRITHQHHNDFFKIVKDFATVKYF